MKQSPQSPSVLRASSFMALATAMSRLFGLVREQVIAYYFGAGPLMDAFNVAFRIPNLLRDLLAEGAFSASFLSQFAQAKTEGTSSMRRLFSQCFWILALVGMAFALALIFFSHSLVGLFAPDYPAGGTQALLTMELLKIMSPFLMFMSLGAVVMAVLNTHKIFFLPSLSPVLFNLSSIVVVFVAAQFFPLSLGRPSIRALAMGVLIGGFLQLCVQLPKLWKLGYSLLPPLSWRELWGPAVKQVFVQLIPGLLGFAASQINILVNTILATSAGVGAVSWLSYAFRLFQLPLGIIGVSLGTGNQVYFAEAWKEKNYSKAAQTLSHSLFLSFCLMLLPALFFWQFPDWPLEILFQRGQFSAVDTEMCSRALLAYSVGLPFYGMHKILLPVFYTLEKQKVALAISVSSILLNILLATQLIGRVGFSMLAWSSSLSIAANALGLFFLLPRSLFHHPKFFSRQQWGTLIGWCSLGGIWFFVARILAEKGVEYFASALTIKFASLAVAGVVGLVLLEFLFYIRGHELFWRKKSRRLGR